MRLFLAMPVVLAALHPVHAAPTPIGQFAGWGAFRTGGYCYVVAEPDRRQAGAHMIVAAPPAPAGVTIRAGTPVRAAVLGMADLRVALVPMGKEARAPERIARRLTASLRNAMRARIAVTGRDDRRTRQVYAMAGFASALDAATLACLTR